MSIEVSNETKANIILALTFAPKVKEKKSTIDLPIDENDIERLIMAVRQKDVKFTISPSAAVLETPSHFFFSFGNLMPKYYTYIHTCVGACVFIQYMYKKHMLQ